jgi:hypothetical protein
MALAKRFLEMLELITSSKYIILLLYFHLDASSGYSGLRECLGKLQFVSAMGTAILLMASRSPSPNVHINKGECFRSSSYIRTVNEEYNCHHYS